MTTEQAIAWLLLEGFAVYSDIGGAARWWLRQEGEMVGIKLTFGRLNPTSYAWNAGEFDKCESSVAYPEHAVEVVKLIQEHGL